MWRVWLAQKHAPSRTRVNSTVRQTQSTVVNGERQHSRRQLRRTSTGVVGRGCKVTGEVTAGSFMDVEDDSSEPTPGLGPRRLPASDGHHFHRVMSSTMVSGRAGGPLCVLLGRELSKSMTAISWPALNGARSADVRLPRIPLADRSGKCRRGLTYV